MENCNITHNNHSFQFISIAVVEWPHTAKSDLMPGRTRRKYEEGLGSDNGKENGNYRDCRGYIDIGAILGCIEIMENKMETTGTIGIL